MVYPTIFDGTSDKVCFMLSGTGYTYDKPILYYSTALLLELGYDVVQINYTFEQQQFEQDSQAISKWSIVLPTLL